MSTEQNAASAIPQIKAHLRLENGLRAEDRERVLRLMVSIGADEVRQDYLRKVFDDVTGEF